MRERPKQASYTEMAANRHAAAQQFSRPNKPRVSNSADSTTSNERITKTVVKPVPKANVPAPSTRVRVEPVHTRPKKVTSKKNDDDNIGKIAMFRSLDDIPDDDDDISSRNNGSESLTKKSNHIHDQHISRHIYANDNDDNDYETEYNGNNNVNIINKNNANKQDESNYWDEYTPPSLQPSYQRKGNVQNSPRQKNIVQNSPPQQSKHGGNYNSNNDNSPRGSGNMFIPPPLPAEESNGWQKDNNDNNGVTVIKKLQNMRPMLQDETLPRKIVIKQAQFQQKSVQQPYQQQIQQLSSQPNNVDQRRLQGSPIQRPNGHDPSQLAYNNSSDHSPPVSSRSNYDDRNKRGNIQNSPPQQQKQSSKVVNSPPQQYQYNNKPVFKANKGKVSSTQKQKYDDDDDDDEWSDDEIEYGGGKCVPSYSFPRGNKKSNYDDDAEEDYNNYETNKSSSKYSQQSNNNPKPIFKPKTNPNKFMDSPSKPRAHQTKKQPIHDDPPQLPYEGRTRIAGNVVASFDEMTPQQQLAFSKQHREVEFKPYTLKQYNEIKPKEYVEISNLKPDLNTDVLIAKRANLERIKQFSKNLNIHNRENMEVAPRAPKSSQLIEMEINKKKIESKRERALQFAKNVPKPKLKAQQEYERGTYDDDGYDDGLGIGHRSAAPDLYGMEHQHASRLDDLEAKHNEAKAQVEAIKRSMAKF